MVLAFRGVRFHRVQELREDLAVIGDTARRR